MEHVKIKEKESGKAPSPAKEKPIESQLGKPMSNEEMESMLEKQKNIAREAAINTSGEGSKLAGDIENVVTSTEEFLKSKNRGEDLQGMSVSLAEVTKKASAEYEFLSYEDKEILNRLAQDSRNIIRTVVYSRDFRKLSLKFLSILDDIFKKEVEQHKPTEEEMEQKPKESIKGSVEGVREELKQEGMEGMKKKVPEHKRKALEDKVYHLVHEIRSNQSLQETINDLFSVGDIIWMKMDRVRRPGLSRNEINKVLYHFEHFLLQFTKQETLDLIKNSIENIKQEVEYDSEFRDLLNDWRSIFVESPGYEQLSIEYTKERVKNVVNLTRNYFRRKKVSDNFNNLRNGLNQFFNDVERDPQRRKLAKDTKILFRDLMYDSSGNVRLNTEGLTQLKNVLIPCIVDQLKYVTIPSIEHDDGKTYIHATNVLLKIADLVPEHIDIYAESAVRIQTQNLDVGPFATLITLILKDMELHVKDAHIHIKRRTFPKLEDNIVADINVVGHKTNVVIQLNLFTIDDPKLGKVPQFELDNVNTTIDTLKLNITQGKHDTLFNFLATVFKPLAKRKMRNAIEEALSEMLTRSTVILNDFSKKGRASQLKLQRRAEEKMKKALEIEPESVQQPSEKEAKPGSERETKPGYVSSYPETRPSEAVGTVPYSQGEKEVKPGEFETTKGGLGSGEGAKIPEEREVGTKSPETFGTQGEKEGKLGESETTKGGLGGEGAKILEQRESRTKSPETFGTQGEKGKLGESELTSEGTKMPETKKGEFGEGITSPEGLGGYHFVENDIVHPSKLKGGRNSKEYPYQQIKKELEEQGLRPQDSKSYEA